MKRLFLLVCFILLYFFSFSQKNIKIKVTNLKGEALISYIYVDGKYYGTTNSFGVLFFQYDGKKHNMLIKSGGYVDYKIVIPKGVPYDYYYVLNIVLNRKDKDFNFYTMSKDFYDDWNDRIKKAHQGIDLYIGLNLNNYYPYGINYKLNNSIKPIFGSVVGFAMRYFPVYINYDFFINYYKIDYEINLVHYVKYRHLGGDLSLGAYLPGLKNFLSTFLGAGINFSGADIIGSQEQIKNYTFSQVFWEFGLILLNNKIQIVYRQPFSMKDEFRFNSIFISYNFNLL